MERSILKQWLICLVGSWIYIELMGFYPLVFNKSQKKLIPGKGKKVKF
ncbi:hypothetical protein BPUTSESOX_612 [uncultured Gammaproteobacteria bacterium]|nr:hypothetical protein [uncultured Gammaproteobacteria bacterium]VVH50905.1 hypothetical protein BPUTSESOX_612 [uncultured Gammaproteobacteria bacterium]